MKKDAYYFSHDANSQDDPKMIFLINDMGMAGVGIFWCLIEKLRCEANFMLPLSAIDAFALRWHASVSDVTKVIKDYKLFEIEGEKFYSERLKRSMLEKSAKARESASYRWKKEKSDATVNERMRSSAIKVKKKNIGNLPVGKKKYTDPGATENGMVF